ncbi:MAG: chain length determinant protein EpsF [Ideonella sp.]|nr:chain length determinant protein EpsF [Ideonella sp.]
MTLTQLLSILKARKWVALLVFGLVVTTTLVASLLLPRQYTGTASVVVDIKPDPVSAMGYPAASLPGFMATQVDILVSDRVALRVIRDLKLLDNPSIRQQWLDDTAGEGSIEQWLVDLLKQKLEVIPSRESNVISIAYSAPEPRFAAGMANAFAQAYMATTLELKVDPAKQYASFFDVRSKDAREALERAQAKVSAFQREKGIIATDERLDIENARLNELSSQLVMIEAVASESRSRQAQAQGASGDKMQEVLTNPVIANMRVEIARNEANLQQLNARLGDRHPQVIEAKANLAELRSRMDAEVSRVTGGVGVTSTINRQREAQVRRELDLQRAKVLRLKGVRDEGQVLAREVENAQRAYDAVMARLTQTGLESQTTQSNVNMLSAAAPPTEPSSPKILLNTALSVILGAMLAAGAVLLLEMLDRRIRAPADVLASLGLPVIGYMPRPDAKRYTASRRLSLMQQRVIGLPAPTQSA